MAKTFLEFDAGELFKKINKDFAKNVKDNVVPLIVSTVKSGKSSVANRRFQAYSQSYKEAIRKGRYTKYGKRTSPPNLTLSGKMLRSFKVRQLVRGGVSIFNSNKLFKYHNDLGAGTGRVIRKVLPTGNNEKFNREITREINFQLEKAIAKSLKK